jgi:hypothetical protein
MYYGMNLSEAWFIIGSIFPKALVQPQKLLKAKFQNFHHPAFPSFLGGGGQQS